MRTINQAVIEAIWGMKKFRVENNHNTYDAHGTGDCVVNFHIVDENDDENVLSTEVVRVPEVDKLLKMFQKK